jgi:hypothetical protein
MSVTGHQPDIRSYAKGEVIQSDNLYGVEIELEDVRVKDSCLIYWDIKIDHSLRGELAREFVTKFPLAGHDIEKSLEEFGSNIIDANPSTRCSIHVHIDIRSWTSDHLRSFLLHWLAVERVLVRYSGNRESNIFCWPFYRTGNKKSIQHVFHQGRIVRASNSYSKYTSLNFNSAISYGSLEVRIHKGEYEADKILRWIGILSKLVEYTKDYRNDLSQLPEFYSGRGPIEFLYDIFGDYTDNLLYNGIGTDLLAGIREAQDVLRSKNLGLFSLNSKMSEIITGSKKDSLFHQIIATEKENA